MISTFVNKYTWQLKLLALGLALVVSFSAGWKINGWKIAKEVNEDKISDLTTQVSTANQNINTIVGKVDAAAAAVTTKMLAVDRVLNSSNEALEKSNTNTRKLSDEISKLEAVNCIVPSSHRGVLRRISEDANKPRESLYGPRTTPTN